MKHFTLAACAGLLALSGLILTGCRPSAGSAEGAAKLNIDGSGTVYPISAAFAELFQFEHQNAQITVGKSGTGAGMEKFAKGEIDLAGASRPIKENEVEKVKAAGNDFIEIPIAYDGICLIVHPSNTWVKSITIQQLNQIWKEDSKVKLWSDIDPSWPKEAIKLYGPTDAHGTYEYFNETVNGDKDNVRADYSQQAEHDPLIQGVANEKYALGYVGFAYAEQNADKLRILPVDGGTGPVEPTAETIRSGSYAPLSRPLFMYISTNALEKNPAVVDFVNFIVSDSAVQAVEAAQFVPFPPETYQAVRAHFESRATGSLFNQPHAGKTVVQVLKGE